MEKSCEIDRLRNDLEIVDVESKRSQEVSSFAVSFLQFISCNNEYE